MLTAHASVADPQFVIQGTPLHDAIISSSYDAFVISSGIGGLTAAVGLAKFGGQRVLVLEQHYTAGGFTHMLSGVASKYDRLVSSPPYTADPDMHASTALMH